MNIRYIVTGSLRLALMVALIVTLAPAIGRPDGAQAAGGLSLPLRFIANAGQTDPAVHFTVKGAGHTLFFTRQEVVFSAVRIADGGTLRSTVRLSFPGANPRPLIEGQLRLPGKASFFIGNDPAGWRVGVPTYGAVVYRDLYPGVDLVYGGREGQLKSEFRLAPGADPGVIQLAYRGVQAAQLLPDGALRLQTALGALVESAPLVYQEVSGARRTVAGRYVPLAQEEGIYRFGFEIGAYDPTRPLIIDPVLGYSSYLGGGRDETGRGVAVDDAGNVYVAGQTSSDDFPTSAGASQPDLAGASDAFVTQLVKTGDTYTYGCSTYLGGTGVDYAAAIAVDAAGNASVTGATMSSDFPLSNPAQPVWGGSDDAFVAQIISTGGGTCTLGYSTYLGGGGADFGLGIALDSGGNAFVTGRTTSSNLFTTPTAIQPACGGAPTCLGDAFVTQVINAGGVYTFGYSSYLGGMSLDQGFAIAVDPANHVFVTGETSSIDFPVRNAPDPIWGLVDAGLAPEDMDITATGTFTYPDAFVSQIVNASGTYTYEYSTYLGGTFPDRGLGIAVDSAGNATVTGDTSSQNFPIRNAVQPTYGGGSSTGQGDAFVTQIVSATGAYTYSYSTFLGGKWNDSGYGIALDAAGDAVVVGKTDSDNFPTHDALDDSLSGTSDAFVTRITNQGGTYAYGFSTYLGGGDIDYGYAVDVDSLSNVYVTGQTKSDDFPTHNALDDSLAGPSDAFVARINWGGLVITKTASPRLVAPGGAVNFTLAYTNDSPNLLSTVVISDYFPRPSPFTRVSYTSSGPAVTPIGSFSYTWQVADIAPGDHGIITVVAVLTNSLTPGTVITNTVTITDTGAYSDAARSTASVRIVVGRAVRLPVIRKQ